MKLEIELNFCFFKYFLVEKLSNDILAGGFEEHIPINPARPD